MPYGAQGLYAPDPACGGHELRLRDTFAACHEDTPALDMRYRKRNLH